MLFWIAAGMLAAIVAALLTRPLLAPGPAGPESSPDQAIYRDQLAEVERDLARGTIAAEEAERARTEIARRLLAADRAGPPSFREAPRRAGLVAAALAGLLVVLGSLALYTLLGHPGTPDLPRAARLAEAETLRASRPSQAEAEAEAAPLLAANAPTEIPEDYLAMIEELRRVVPTRPDDLQGWELLAFHEARLGRYAEAARAQSRVVELKGEEATAEDWARLADHMVAAAGHFVTPEAEMVLAGLMERDPRHPALLYYLGLLEAQTGRSDRAFPLWRRVIEEAPSDSLHYRLAAGQIEDVAWLAGVDYSLPAAGPTPEDMAAAADMDPEAREEMIRGMVDQLSGRLAAEGGPPADWARLVTSLAVLGDRDRAAAILSEARTVFFDVPEAKALLDEAAQAAGLAP